MPAGYSGTPLAQKLGIKPGHHLALVGAPRGWSIDDLPPDVRITRRRTSTPADVVVAFFSELAAVQQQIEDLAQRITINGGLWLAWPRRAGGHHSDITENGIRAAVLPLGLVDVKVAALDEDWSGLKVVWRKALRH
jgi:hypothetical protein